MLDSERTVFVVFVFGPAHHGHVRVPYRLTPRIFVFVPFVCLLQIEGENAPPELCAIGLRNPWRCSFDRETDELYCG